MRVKLEEVCKRIYAGGDVPKNSCSKVKTLKYSVPIYTNGELNNGLYGYTDLPKENELSITIAARGTIGFTAIRKEPFFPAIRLITVVPDLSKVSVRYMLYALKKCKPKSNGTSISQLTVPDIKKTYIDIYNMPEQEKIADKLELITRIIDSHECELNNLDKLIKARFVEMFGEIDDKNGWPRNKWEDVVTIKNGKDYKNHLIKEGGYPVYGTGGEMCRVNKFLCPENTVIVGRKGSINNPLLVKEKFWNVDTAFGVIPDKKVLNYLYFYEFCRKFDFMKLNKATTLPSTTKADLLKIEINIPPIDLQNQFADFVKQVDKSKLAVQQSLEKTQQLFDSLMQEYFG